MGEVVKVKLGDIFKEAQALEPERWDIDWISKIKIPENVVLNQAQAIKLMTDTARAIEWCGEKVAILISMVENSKDTYKKEWAEACNVRSMQKAHNSRTVDADRDGRFLASKNEHNRLKGYLAFFMEKQKGFTNMHYAMREVVKAGYNEMGVANWGNAESVYPEPERTAPEDDREREDFDQE